MTIQSSITDQQFLQQFETCTLPPEYFNHLGHIRICWLYLQQHSSAETARIVSARIKRFAEFLGDAGKFNVTLSHAMVQLISRRAKNSDSSWQNFVEANPELVDSWRDLLSGHYSPPQLFGELAKQTCLPPDLKPW